jgi:hypothetical protein
MPLAMPGSAALHPICIRFTSRPIPCRRPSTDDAGLRYLLKEYFLATACRRPRPALANLLLLAVISLLGWLFLWLAAAVALDLLA